MFVTAEEHIAHRYLLDLSSVSAVMKTLQPVELEAVNLREIFNSINFTSEGSAIYQREEVPSLVICLLPVLNLPVCPLGLLKLEIPAPILRT